MRVSESERAAIERLRKNWYSSQKIAEILKIGSSTVKYPYKRHLETGSNQDRPLSGRPVTESTNSTVRKIKKRITRNPKQFMRKLARTLNSNREVVRKTVPRKLKMFPYKQVKAHILTDKVLQNSETSPSGGPPPRCHLERQKTLYDRRICERAKQSYSDPDSF
ncbi:hypothetical protein ANCDUO_22942 [Ancylostoma duodenale]|uniref:Transposase IS30-like HTH domain-containing protein n=1 Tax=Ancylostoma duodenale TaxID=51022 RepID=A0A0C2FQ16_9BILA|nr:hypothetical protein ANCDUO_22942 [Ancylostoma duodenale]